MRLAISLLVLPVLACGPEVKTAEFAVFSDAHLYDAAALGASGPDFEAYLAQDRKMIVQSQEVLDAVLDDLGATPLDFVLVSGDLTKDGERLNHELMARKLAALERTQRDLHVYVVPGNHDVWNPHAVSYLTSPPAPADQVSPADFRRIYAEFGYREALAQDPASLSYLAEPRPGIWILAVDSAEYESNRELGGPVSAGRLLPATQAWILEVLRDAARLHKTVIAMMHHGVIEHYRGQASLFSAYLLEDYPEAGKALADAGLRIVFTGHYHANDAVSADLGTSRLLDVETGSLVTAPSPYRIVRLDVRKKTYDITTRHVGAIASHPADFQAWSRQYLHEGMTALALYQLTHAPFSLDTATATALTPIVAGGMEAHYAGDEAAPAAVAAQIAAMTGSSDPRTAALGQAIAGVWTDLPPADGDLSIAVE